MFNLGKGAKFFRGFFRFIHSEQFSNFVAEPLGFVIDHALPAYVSHGGVLLLKNWFVAKGGRVLATHRQQDGFLRFQIMVHFQVGDKFWCECGSRVFEMVYDIIPKCCVEMVVLYRFVDFDEAHAIHQVRILCVVDDGRVKGAVGEARAQCALQNIKLLWYFFYIGLETALGKYEFAPQIWCGYGIQTAPFKSRTGNAVAQVCADIFTVGKSHFEIEGECIGIVGRRFSTDQDMHLFIIVGNFLSEFFELDIVADEGAVGVELRAIIAAIAAQVVVVWIGYADEANALLSAFDGDVAKFNAMGKEEAGIVFGFGKRDSVHEPAPCS